jgi:hypothetical protein
LVDYAVLMLPHHFSNRKGNHADEDEIGSDAEQEIYSHLYFTHQNTPKTPSVAAAVKDKELDKAERKKKAKQEEKLARKTMKLANHTDDNMANASANASVTGNGTENEADKEEGEEEESKSALFSKGNKAKSKRKVEKQRQNLVNGGRSDDDSENSDGETFIHFSFEPIEPRQRAMEAERYAVREIGVERVEETTHSANSEIISFGVSTFLIPTSIQVLSRSLSYAGAHCFLLPFICFACFVFETEKNNTILRRKARKVSQLWRNRTFCQRLHGSAGLNLIFCPFFCSSNMKLTSLLSFSFAERKTVLPLCETRPRLLQVPE